MKSNQRALLPNLLTFSNLFLGFLAIVMFSQGRFLTGSWLIVVAALMDGMDGAVARWVKSSSSFGGEVDSLADVVSFGVAPAILVYNMMPGALGQPIAVLIGSLPLIAAATRLARYNILSAEHGHVRTFSGMPTPCAALLFVGFFIYSQAEPFDANPTPVWFSLVPLVSLLMLSPIPFRRIPVVQIHGAKRPWLSVTLLVAAAVALVIDMSRTLFPLMVIYLLIGPVEWILAHTGLQVTQSPEQDDAVPATERRNLLPRRRK